MQEDNEAKASAKALENLDISGVFDIWEAEMSVSVVLSDGTKRAR